MGPKTHPAKSYLCNLHGKLVRLTKENIFTPLTLKTKIRMQMFAKGANVLHEIVNYKPKKY